MPVKFYLFKSSDQAQERTFEQSRAHAFQFINISRHSMLSFPLAEENYLEVSAELSRE